MMGSESSIPCKSMDCKSAVLAGQNLEMVTHIPQCSGLIINNKMSLSQELEFLGMLVNTNTLLISLPADRVKEIMAEAIRISHLLSHFLGNLSAAIQAIPPVPLFFHCLQRLSTTAIITTRFLCPYHNPPKKNSPGGEKTFSNGLGSP